MKLPISEEFSSIQGEGMFAGVPSYFMRTSGCNLRCWWCDTPYTSWKPEMKFADTVNVLERIKADGARHIVITGGEPMLHVDAIRVLVRCCQGMEKIVTVETNGTVPPGDIWPDLWSVSPKLASSTPSESLGKGERALHLRHIDAAPLKQFETQGTRAQFKFVVVTAEDMDEVEKMVASHGLKRSNVWLMPEGRTANEVMGKARWVVEECKARGFNLSMRVHTLLWGAKRGV